MPRTKRADRFNGVIYDDWYEQQLAELESSGKKSSKKKLARKPENSRFEKLRQRLNF